MNGTGNPITAFAGDLRELRCRAGQPSYREMARYALFSPSVLSNAASGRRLPTLQVALAFVEACGGDRNAWAERWRQLMGESVPPPPPDRGHPAAPAAAGEHPAPVVLPRPAQLPPPPAVFVGRRAQLAEVRTMSSGPAAAPLLISGGIGVGKTALALCLAEHLAGDAPDGQLYADFGGVGGERVAPETVLLGFLRALGVPATHIPADQGQRTALYRSLLAERSVVVLLDDAREEAQIRPLLAPPGSSVTVVTSRARLLGLDGVRRLHLGLLQRTESVSMLMAYVGSRRINAEPEAATLIAEQCGDLPLALTIAGRRIATQPAWPLRHVAQQLADRARLLDQLRAGDLSVRGRIDSAYHRLSLSARRALGRLETHAATPGAPQSAAPELAEDVADSLVECGLLQQAATAGCYRIPPMVELFVAEQQRLERRRTFSVAGTRDGRRPATAVDCSVGSTVPVKQGPELN